MKSYTFYEAIKFRNFSEKKQQQLSEFKEHKDNLTTIKYASIEKNFLESSKSIMTIRLIK